MENDIFLGWLRMQAPGGEYQDYYVRQLRDWKMSAVIEEMIPQGMRIYAWLCGWTLARARTRSGDRIAIAAYLGYSNKFDNAGADFAETYADQNERDHAGLAVRSPTDESRPGLGCDLTPRSSGRLSQRRPQLRVLAGQPAVPP